MLKGLVHPKMKILSLITHPNVVLTLLFNFGTWLEILLIKSESFLNPSLTATQLPFVLLSVLLYYSPTRIHESTTRKNACC